jgi:outer membrane protein assembly factor BamA
VRLSPDLADVGGVVGYESGFGGQSQIQFSDLLGNHHLGVGIGIYGSLRDSDLYVAYSNRSRRTSWSVAGFQFRKRYGVLGSLRSADIEHQTYRGVRATASRPFSKFTRIEGSLQAAGVEGRFYLGETAAQADADSSIETLRSFVGPGVAWVQDSAIYGLSGPIGGRRFRVGLEGAVGEIRYTTLEADLRQYWNLRKWYAFAVRGYAVTSRGSTPQTAYLGGAQSLRGYDYGALVGNHALLATAEFRFPLVRHLALGWPLPLEMGPVQGVLFADAATAWDDRAFVTSRAVREEQPGKRPQAALGFGMRFNLGYLVLKLDWAQRFDTGTGARSPGSSVALGTDF